MADRKTTKERDQRIHSRHAAREHAHVDFMYEVRAQVEVRPVRSVVRPKTVKYRGVCKNISAEGLCFVSAIQLTRGEKLELEFYAAKGKPPLHMQGNVRWSRVAEGSPAKRARFDTGLRLIAIDGEIVHDSVHFDEKYELYWSNVLEKVSEKWKKSVRRKNAKR